MSRIKRAVIMAAGFGSRMQPITIETPKPLIKVNGQRMIDSIIDALHKNNIFEIYVVVGYKKEAFYKWAEKKEGIKLIENNLYKSCNNISSLYAARDFIGESFILDGDQIIYNKEILNPEFTKSGYSCIWTEDQTDEWLMTVNENKKVISCSRVGGKKGWQLFSISRWTKEDGEKLKHYIEKEFIENKNTQSYWDDIAMFCYPESFDLTIYPMNKGDIVEIDSFEELCEIDKSYLSYKN